MSAKLILAVWSQFPQGGGRLQALQAIAELSNEQGHCCIRIEQIAAAARMSRRTTQRAVNQLRDERWIVSSRMLGQGARVVYQLNLPLLARSQRRNHDAVAAHAPSVEEIGPTAAGLLERVAARRTRCQSDAASAGANLTPREDECQIGTAPNRHRNGGERPGHALEGTGAPCHEEVDGGWSAESEATYGLDAWLAAHPEFRSPALTYRGQPIVCDDPPPPRQLTPGIGDGAAAERGQK